MVGVAAVDISLCEIEAAVVASSVSFSLSMTLTHPHTHRHHGIWHEVLAVSPILYSSLILY